MATASLPQVARALTDALPPETFDLAFIMSSQETTELIAIKLYRLAFQEWQTGPSCALAYMVLIMVLAITNIYVKYLNRAKDL